MALDKNALVSIQRNFGSHIDEASKKYGVPKDILQSVIYQESRGNPNAVGKEVIRNGVSNGTAKGLMQFMDNTWKDEHKDNPTASQFDAKANIDAGARYLATKLKEFGGNEELAIAAYTSGAGSVKSAKNKIPNKDAQLYVDSIKEVRSYLKGESSLPVSQRRLGSTYSTGISDVSTRTAMNSASLQSQLNSDIARANNIANSSFGESFTAAMTSMNLSSPTTQIMDELDLRSKAGKADDNYKYDQSYAAKVLAAHNLDYTDDNLGLLSKSINNKDFMNRIDHLSGLKDVRNFANQSLGDTAMTSWGIAGAFIGDPSLALSLTALPMSIARMGLAARAVSSFGTAAAIQGGISMFKHEYMPNHTMDDVLLDTVFGGIVDGSLARGMFKPKIPLAEPSKIVTIRQSFAASVAETPVETRFDLSKNYGWSFAPSKQVVDPFTDVEWETTAKALGHNEPLLITDKNVRKQISDAIEQQRIDKALNDEAMLKAQRDIAEKEAHTAKKTAEKTSAKATTKEISKAVAGEVLTEAEKKTKILDDRIKASGLSKEEFYKRIDSLSSDTKDIKDTIKEIASWSSEKTKGRAFRDMQNTIDGIRKISPSHADSLQYVLDKHQGLIKTNRAILDANKKIKFESNAKSFKNNVKQLSSYLKNVGKKISDAEKQVLEFKHIGTVETMAKANKAEMDRLSAIDKAIEKASKGKNQVSKDAVARLNKEAEDIRNGINKRASENAKSSSESLARQKEIYQRMASAVDEVVIGFEKTLNDMMLDMFQNTADKEKYLNELATAINREFGSDLKITIKDGAIHTEGHLKFVAKGNKAFAANNKLVLGLGAGLALSTVSAFAGDGSNDSWFGIGGFALIVLGLGVSASVVKSVLEHGGVVPAAKAAYKDIRGIESNSTTLSDPFYKRVKDKVMSVDTYRTGYLESLATILKSKNESIKELGRKLVTDHIDPTKSLSAMADKTARIGAADYNIAVASEKAYKEWLIATNQSETLTQKFAYIFEDTPLRLKFEEEVLDHIEFGTEASSAIKEYAKAIKLEQDKMVKYMNECGVDGFSSEDIAKFKGGHVPRLVNSEAMMKIAQTPDGIKKLTSTISEMIASKIGKLADDKDVMDLADKYVRSVLSNSRPAGVGSTNVAKMVEAMDRLGLDISGIDVEAVAKEAHSSNDVLSRGKMRIPMDLSKFKPFKISVNGEEVEIKLATLYDRNAQQLMRRVVNEQYGYAAAVRITGYKSYGALMNKIAGNVDDYVEPEVVKTLSTYANSLFGRPAFDTSSEMAQNVMVIKGVTGMALTFSTLTTSMETLKALSAAFGFHGSSAAKKQFLISTANLIARSFGREGFKDTYLAKVMLSQVNGRGGAHVKGDVTMKGLDDLTNLTEQGVDGIRRVIKKASVSGYITSRLIQVDDFFKKIANIYSATRLARLAHGIETMGEGSKSLYGIDDKVLSRMKEKLNLDSHNEVIDLDFDNWSIKDQDIFRNVTDAISMDRSTWTTLGAIPTGSINSTAGIMMSGLTHFVSQTYTTQALAKFRHGGFANYADSGLWVLSGAMSYYAKAYATGREPNHDDAIMYAIMQSPIAAPFAVAGMMIDPVALSVVQKAIIAAKSNTEYVLNESNNNEQAR